MGAPPFIEPDGLYHQNQNRHGGDNEAYEDEDAIIYKPPKRECAVKARAEDSDMVRPFYLPILFVLFTV